MSEYNHSAFLGSKSANNCLSTMSPDDRHTLQSYFSDQVTPIPLEVPDDDIRVQFPHVNHYMTVNGIFVALRGAREMNMKPNIDDYHIKACRRVSEQILHETLEVQAIEDVFCQGRVDRIIETKGHITSQLVVIELARSASWIEVDEAGWERSLPLRPYRLLPSRLESVAQD